MKFTSQNWYDGRYGTYCGERVEEEMRIVEGNSWADGFRKLHGFLPDSALDSRGRAKGNWKPEPGTGYRYINSEGLSMSAELHTIVQYDDFMAETYGIRLKDSDGDIVEIVTTADEVRADKKG